MKKPEHIHISIHQQSLEKLGKHYGIKECGNCGALNADYNEICAKCGQTIEI